MFKAIIVLFTIVLVIKSTILLPNPDRNQIIKSCPKYHIYTPKEGCIDLCSDPRFKKMPNNLP